MSRERQIQIGAAGIILLGVGLLVFVGLGFAQGGGPEPPAYWAKSFRADRPRPAAEMVSLARPAGAASAQAAAEYEVTAIEPPETLDSSRAFGINNAGQVVGRFFNLNETLGAEEDRTAYIWNEASGARLLPTLAGHSSAWDVDQGELGSGFSFNAGIDQHAVRWDGAAGTILDLGTLENAEGVPGRTSTAYGINSLGEVVGSADTPNLVGDFMPFHAFIYSDESGMLDLGTLTADYPEWQNGYSIAYGVNTEGQVVGIANDSDFYYYPFIFDPVNDLRALNIDPAHTPAGTYPQWYAVAINDTGVIGGFVTVADNQSLPYYWPDPNSDPVPLPMPDGFPYGEVYGINLSGIMVGIMWDSDADTGAAEHAFVFDTTNGLRDLNNLIPAGSGWVLNFARDINASGQIVGTGDYLGERRGFVLDAGTFTDVSRGHWAFEWIEALYEAGITSGCSLDPPRFCPDDPVTRGQMALFLERGMRGSEYIPPSATGSVFDDVASDYWAAAWIEQLAADGITIGCSTDPPLYCPEATASRAEMAIFIEKAMHWPDGYTPPAPSGTVFEDVAASYWAASWIEQLYSDGITNGCSTTPAHYCPEASVTRAQMAVFLGRAFNLPLP
jgi:probable HAF family extracellular repeat protein